MQPPDGNTVIAWGTAIATLIIVIRQQINASAGKKRGDEQTAKINDIHATSTNGQVEILKTRALALRAVATLRGLPNDVLVADQAEKDLVAYVQSLGVSNETNDSTSNPASHS